MQVRLIPYLLVGVVMLFPPESLVVGPSRQAAPSPMLGGLLCFASGHRCSPSLHEATSVTVAFHQVSAMLHIEAGVNQDTAYRRWRLSLRTNMPTHARLAWLRLTDGITRSVAALSAVTCPGQPSPQLPQAYITKDRDRLRPMPRRMVPSS
jgi:hypothetical protein